jgi:hypothetical protein
MPAPGPDSPCSVPNALSRGIDLGPLVVGEAHYAKNEAAERRIIDQSACTASPHSGQRNGLRLARDRM